MADSNYDRIICPVTDCAYEDHIRSVAAHVSGSDDGDHEWDRLGFDGPREFVEHEKRRQDGDPSDVERTTGDGAVSSGGDRPETVVAATGGGWEDLDLTFVENALATLVLLRRYDAESLSGLDPFRLTNLYALLSDLSSTAEDARKEVREALLAEVQDDREIEADVGAVRRYTSERTSLRAEEAVLDAVERAGVDPERVMAPDRSRVEDAVEATDLSHGDAFETEERVSVRRQDIDEERRRILLEDFEDLGD
jgi:hypothetical protein